MNDPPPSAPQPNHPPSGPHPPDPGFTVFGLFFGRDGLRTFWGVALFLGLLLVALPNCIGPLAYSLFPHVPRMTGGIAPSAVLVSEGAGLLCAVIATWIMARIEHRPVAVYGFRPRRAPACFFAGLATGVALLSLLVFALRATGLLVFDARLLSGRGVLRYGCVWLAAFLLVGLREEIVSRGYLQFALTRGFRDIGRRLFGSAHADALGFWTAALVLSFAFGFNHRTNPGESPLGLLSAGLVGLLFALSLWRTGSLWWAIGFHAAWDWAQSFLYGVADSGLVARGRLFATHPAGPPLLSGGLTGPEGSILLLPVMAAGVAVVLTLPRARDAYIPKSAPR